MTDLTRNMPPEARSAAEPEPVEQGMSLPWLAVYKRELGLYFRSPIAYGVAFAILFFLGLLINGYIAQAAIGSVPFRRLDLRARSADLPDLPDRAAADDAAAGGRIARGDARSPDDDADERVAVHRRQISGGVDVLYHPAGADAGLPLHHADGRHARSRRCLRRLLGRVALRRRGAGGDDDLVGSDRRPNRRGVLGRGDRVGALSRRNRRHLDRWARGYVVGFGQFRPRTRLASALQRRRWRSALFAPRIFCISFS